MVSLVTDTDVDSLLNEFMVEDVMTFDCDAVCAMLVGVEVKDGLQTGTRTVFTAPPALL